MRQWWTATTQDEMTAPDRSASSCRFSAGQRGARRSPVQWVSHPRQRSGQWTRSTPSTTTSGIMKIMGFKPENSGPRAQCCRGGARCRPASAWARLAVRLGHTGQYECWGVLFLVPPRRSLPGLLLGAPRRTGIPVPPCAAQGPPASHAPPHVLPPMEALQLLFISFIHMTSQSLE